MISKTAMLALVKGFRAADVDAALAENPALKAIRDRRGRNWLHVCCGQRAAKTRADDSIATAGVLLWHGFDKNGAAFREGTWQATPVWYAIARGQNLALAEFLLKQGASPQHSLWAASFNNDLPAIRLLVKHGADLEAVTEDATPFLDAIKWSRFGPAAELLRLGANPNFRDSRGMTALHHLLKKSSDPKFVALVAAAGARGDIKDNSGATAIDILRRKKDPAYRKLADALAARA